jgi:hypothetical protein
MKRVTNVGSGQTALRWEAPAFLEGEPEMTTLKGYYSLWILRAKLVEARLDMAQS